MCGIYNLLGMEVSNGSNKDLHRGTAVGPCGAFSERLDVSRLEVWGRRLEIRAPWELRKDIQITYIL